MTLWYQRRRVPESRWRYIWQYADTILLQTPAVIFAIVLGATLHMPWLVVAGCCLLGVNIAWVGYLYRTHARMLAAQNQLSVIEQTFRTRMTQAGAPVSLVDQMVAHMNDGDVSGAQKALARFLDARS